MKTVQVRNITLGEGRPKICVPIVGQTKDDILLEAGTFARIPVDVVEWRVDWFEDVFDTDKVLDVAKDLQTILKDTPRKSDLQRSLQSTQHGCRKKRLCRSH